MVEYALISLTTDDTLEIGRSIATWLQPGDIVAFYGELGSGKTYFIKGICEGLKMRDEVTSPTFTIMNVYEGDVTVYHFDFYRIDSEDDIYGLGLEDYFYADGICLIEWADRIESFLPKDRIEIRIDTPSDPNSGDRRDIKINLFGSGIEHRNRSDLRFTIHST